MVFIASAGCGSSDSNGGSGSTGERTAAASTTVTTATSLTKQQFINRANAICKEHWIEIRRGLPGFQAEHPDASEAELFAGQTKVFILPGIEIQFDYIRYMGAPPGEAPQVEEMIGAMQVAIETAEEQRITSPAQLLDLFASFNDLAHEYGANGCIVRESYFE